MENLFTLGALTIAAIPVVTGLVSVLKSSLDMPSKYAPLASLAFGIAAVALIGGAWQAIVAQGLLVGLAASGLYSGGKAIASPAAQ